MPFGLTAAGFLLKRLADVKAELEDEFRGAFGANVKLTSKSVNGQFIGIFSEQIAAAWEQLQAVYLGSYLDDAEGVQLDEIVALAGLSRLPAASSTVTLQLEGDALAVIAAGVVVRDPVTGVRFVTTEEVTLDGAGAGEAEAEAEVTGPVRALAGTLTEIVTPTSGLTSATNGLDAVEGSDVESDARLRLRHKRAFRAANGSSVEAVLAALLRLDADGVTAASIVENESWHYDVDARPPKSFEAIVRGGTDQLVADTIWAAKPAGIETVGNTAVVVTDSQGNPHTIHLTRPGDVDIWVAVTYEPTEDVEDDVEDQITTAILDYGNELVDNADVYAWRLKQRIEAAGLAELDLTVGRADPPLASRVAITAEERARFDSTRISFTRLPPS